MGGKEYILLTIIFALGFCLFRQCEKPINTINTSQPIINIQTDTIVQYVKGRPDTIHDTITKWYTKLIPYHIKDSVTLTGDSVSLYSTLIEDSLLSGELISTVKGQLLSSDFKYVAKFPKYIYKTDTFKQKVVTKKTITKDPWEFYVGGVVGGNPAKFTLQPAALVRVPKKGFMFGYGYDVVQKTHNVHLYTKLRR
jgi:hypothetical protein